MNKQLRILPLAAMLFMLSACVTLDLRPTRRIEALIFDIGEIDTSMAKAFQVPDSAAFHEKLRQSERLDSVLGRVTDDHDRALVLMKWAHGRVGKLRNGLSHYRSGDDVHEALATGKRLGADAPAHLMTAACQSVGLIARTVFVMTNDAQETKREAGHYLTEVWINEPGRWAMFDPRFNIAPLVGDFPLSAVDLQMSIINNRPYRFTRWGADLSEKDRVDYLRFIPHRLFYFATPFEQRQEGDQERSNGEYTHLMLVPLEIDPPVIFERQMLLDTYRVTRNRTQFYPEP